MENKEKHLLRSGISICKCGHKGDGSNSEHKNSFSPGHGSCKLCNCERFTWSSFTPEWIRNVVERDKLKTI